jgi:hypothetical protein
MVQRVFNGWGHAELVEGSTPGRQPHRALTFLLAMDGGRFAWATCRRHMLPGKAAVRSRRSESLKEALQSTARECAAPS